MIGRLYVCALAFLLLVSLWGLDSDKRAWARHAAAYDCEMIGVLHPRYRRTIEALTWRPGGELWRCNDGKVYWR